MLSRDLISSHKSADAVSLELIVSNKGSKFILKVEEVPDHQLVREGEKKAAEVKFSSHLKLDTLFIKNNKKDEEK